MRRSLKILRVMRNKHLRPEIVVGVLFHILHGNPEPYPCSRRNTLIRIIGRNHISIFVGHHIVEVHRNLITPNTVSVNKFSSLYLKLFYRTRIGFPNHLNCSLARCEFVHVTHMRRRNALL